MRPALRRREPRRKRIGRALHGECARREQGRLAAIDGKFEPRLMAADELHIDATPAAGNRAARYASRARRDRCRSACTAHRGCTARRGAAAGQAPAYRPPGPSAARAGASRSSSALRKAKSKAALCITSIAPSMKPMHIVGTLVEARLGREEFGGEPVHLEGRLGHVALGVEVAMPHPPRSECN